MKDLQMVNKAFLGSETNSSIGFINLLFDMSIGIYFFI